MDQIQIQIHNDGKERQDSWEARLEITHRLVLTNFSGFGAHEDEAVADLQRQVKLLIERLTSLEFDNRIRVSWDGTPL